MQRAFRFFNSFAGKIVVLAGTILILSDADAARVCDKTITFTKAEIENCQDRKSAADIKNCLGVTQKSALSKQYSSPNCLYI